ncbi:hypothetical protein VC83_00418 [Pseudogymnoascus destructans]|uniref:Uncharacterized protein n=1 Tax=Pseudogymnoascus destructans TaxID=655981 RepID=A0A177AM41_9PEZI|nr:uncharacterized protein VC83_00418 [Pseudogymnoascus destructans]OAF63126.1 hypothetical protein VC83_00418 [Pseudogymnoascus destructans]
MRVLLQGAGLWPYVVAKTDSVTKDGTAEQQKAGTIIATALGDEVISRLAFEDFEDGRAVQEQLSLSSKCDLMNQLHVTFEILQLFENEPLRLAYWVKTLYLSLQVSSFKVNVFNMIHHRRRAAKFTYPLFVALRFIPDAEWALLLAAIKGENGIEGPGLRGLFFEDTWRNADVKTVS